MHMDAAGDDSDSTSTRRRTRRGGRRRAASSSGTFTVANINRGIIYLRPVVRAGSQLQRVQLARAGGDGACDGNHDHDHDRDCDRDRARDSCWHARARSFSTARGLTYSHTATSHSAEPGTYKVVIRGRRPQTADTIPIPDLDHHLGSSPRFTAQAQGGPAMLAPPPLLHSLLPSRAMVDPPHPPHPQPTPTHARRAASSAPRAAVAIGPGLYDALTANPDDPRVVRFSPSGDILAATPSRLIAHITSPSFLDYELLSDFFLTFRSFLSSRHLAAYLIARLRWAVDRQDDFGRIVRVRTFVALRHWILNYFVDDFVPVYPLRAYFCRLVNLLCEHLESRPDAGGGDIKIVGELKKCWRRTCALYWDSDDGNGPEMAAKELLPGGHDRLQASFEEHATSPPAPSTPPRKVTSLHVDALGSTPTAQFPTRNMGLQNKARHTPQNSLSSPYLHSQQYSEEKVPLSPASERSIHVLSCSIPMRGMHRVEADHHDMPLYPHPVPYPAPVRFAAGPQGPKKKRNHPSHSHKRSGSFSDASRDHRAPLSIPKMAAVDTAISAVFEMPGSLIRGGIFQPNTPYIDVRHGRLHLTRSHMELELLHGSGHDRHGQATNPGMKKVFGSVRRALSSKQPSASAPQLPNDTHQHYYPPPSTRSSNPIVTTSLSGSVHRRRYARPPPQLRIDVLASKVADSFRQALTEQLEHEQQPPPQRTWPDLSGFQFDFENQETCAIDEQPPNFLNDQTLQSIPSTISPGNRSIEDTGTPQLPLMSGALPSQLTENSPLAHPFPSLHRRVVSIDERLEDGTSSHSQGVLPHQNTYTDDTMDRRRSLGDRTQRPTLKNRRSLSEGRMQLHSFRRRGSTKASLARSASLRRNASYNSGLSRQNTTGSIATFQTMSSDSDPFFLDRQQTGSVAPPRQVRQLRRRPGGDLRAVGNVHDLEHVPRPHSTGSISNRTHSISNSVLLLSGRYVDLTNEAVKTREQTQEDEQPKKKPVSLVDTHSSQPNLRPSFEAEVAKLAALPDDTDDDGGVESALMKLEGRYEKKTPDLSPRATVVPEIYHPMGYPSSSSPPFSSPAENSSHTEHHPDTNDALAPGHYSTVGSEDSYSSIPLLDRGLNHFATSPRSRALKPRAPSVTSPPLKPDTSSSWFYQPSSPNAISPSSSVEYVVETESMKDIVRDCGARRSSIVRASFLLDDGENLSDLSDDDSAFVTRSDRTSHGVRSFFDDEPANLEAEQGTHPMHLMRHPPTPPLTGNRGNDYPRVDIHDFARSLPTPGLTPPSRTNNQSFGQVVQPPDHKGLGTDSPQPTPAHLPFILAYDSETLAEQFTIIEKDALDEIDWKELIELRWKQSSPQIRDWVEYLRTQDARGVDVVIARFNLVVKWTVSECLLTGTIEERARCIVKYIHIAAHARRLRNYATMYQITIALLSTDISRLKRTWALIPAAEMQTMRNLEALVQPLKNFHNLRVEMETATVEDGCIPFIGIYTRDLIYNAQKPAFIEAQPAGGERLVNFDRHHTAAMIVKNLLRLLEASSKYTFTPDPDIISKCLWMAALGDEELTALSRKYE